MSDRVLLYKLRSNKCMYLDVGAHVCVYLFTQQRVRVGTTYESLL